MHWRRKFESFSAASAFPWSVCSISGPQATTGIAELLVRRRVYAFVGSCFDVNDIEVSYNIVFSQDGTDVATIAQSSYRYATYAPGGSWDCFSCALPTAHDSGTSLERHGADLCFFSFNTDAGNIGATTMALSPIRVSGIRANAARLDITGLTFASIAAGKNQLSCFLGIYSEEALR